MILNSTIVTALLIMVKFKRRRHCKVSPHFRLSWYSWIFNERSNINLVPLQDKYLQMYCKYRNSSYSFLPWIVSSFEQILQQKFSLLGKKLKYCGNYLNLLQFPNSKINSFPCKLYEEKTVCSVGSNKLFINEQNGLELHFYKGL